MSDECTAGENCQIREKVEKLERLAIAAMREQAETYAKTDAIHSRSTSRHKSKAVEAAERARSQALCEAIAIVNDERTPLEVLLRLADAMRGGSVSDTREEA